MLEALEEYIDLLESFKTHKISSLIDQINLKVFAALKSAKLNPKVAPYFSQLPIDPELLKLEFTPENAPKIKRLLDAYYAKIPLTGFELEPENVSQIKKLLNALHYAHITFSDLEGINLRKDLITSFTDLNFLYQKTINDAYEASYLLTHLDVDVKEMFQEELQLLYPAIATINKLVEQNAEQTKEFAETVRNYPISYKLGEVTGTALEQMRPSTGNLDYDFLTQFSALLPGYIDKVTQYIQQYSSQLVAQEPTLNNAKLEELQKTALDLLNDLESLKGGSRLFVSFKFLRYIHIISNIITLSKSSLEQIGHLSDSSQDVIRDNLAQLKYVVLPQLFGLVDKIEVNCMLKPGTLSVPLMEKVKPLYDTLIFYAKKPVNFQDKGEELLSIEDSLFVSLRLENTYQRIDTANKALFKIKNVKEASTRFYAILKDEQYKNLTLQQLPKEVKAQLIEEYKIIKPYMSQVNADFNELIINSLLEITPKPGYIASAWEWLKGIVTSSTPLPADHISHLLAAEEALNKLLKKKVNTQQFHIDLNKDLIESVLQTTNLTLFPYSDTTSVVATEQLEKIPPPVFPAERATEIYLLDESIALKAADEHNPLLQFVNDEPHKTIANPEQLNADQTLVLYQWYKNKLERFNTAKKAYEKFVELIDEQVRKHKIEQSQRLDAVTLDFLPLYGANKQKLQALYQQFSIYFINGVPEEMKPLVKSFDKFLNPSPTDGTNPAPPDITDYENLKTHFQKFFDNIGTKWTQKNQFYLKQAQHKFASEEQYVFLVDEARALRSEGELNPTLKFSKEKGNKLVATPEQLTADQALTLYQWYRNKRNKFEVARDAYNKFIMLLNDQAKKYPSPNGAKFMLNRLDEDVKAECRKLYNLFQPYFINGIPAPMREVALDFDRYLVHSFAEKGVTDKTPTIDLFEKFNEHFQIYFTDVDLSWSRKSQSYLKLAQEKFASENNTAKLAPDANANRAHYLIKHTHYSNFIYEFRQSLQQLTTVFNAAMQAELKIKSSDGVPYPELQDKYLAKAQSKQVLAIKKMYNGLYHVEQIVRQLENLNDKSYKTTYVYYLIQAYSHINDLMKLSNGLAQDEQLKLVSSELVEKAQNLWATIQENIEAYQESPTEVAPLKKTVKYSGLWYTLNAFNVIPKHIRSLRNASFLTQQDLDELHVSAKKASLSIETLIDSSDSYFKLFLQVPSMLRLFREFRGRLNEFISTVHDTATSNLGEFNTHVFTPMLLEADQWEDKLGLAPGSLSGPLKKILDQYYKGLLHPLKLPSKTHIQFVCDKSPIKERLEVTQQNIAATTKDLQKQTQTHAGLIKLYGLIEQYNELTGGIFFAPDEQAVKKLMDQIIIAYKETLPRLVELNRELQFLPNPKISKQDKKFDAQLNAVLKEYDPKLSDIRALVKISHAHYMGLKNSATMELNTAQEKLAYLTQLNVAQDQANEDFVLEYTTESFDKQCKELAFRPVGLQYIHEEYSFKLQAYLLRFKNGIVQKAKSKDDINLSIETLLQEKLADFERDYYVKYYKLDGIKGALAQFRNYFSVSSSTVYENLSTITKKTNEINKLDAISKNTLLSVDERINKIKYQVEKDPSFSRIILEQKPVEHFSFEYLKLCIYSLLEALYLYTPEKNARLNDLKKATTQEPSIAYLSSRFGVFSTNKKAGAMPPPIEASPLNGEENPMPPLSPLN